MLSSSTTQSYQEIAHWLQQQQSALASQREKVRALHLQMDKSAFFEATLHKSKRDSDIHVQSLRYVMDISQYFTDGDPWAKLSWYDHFLEGLNRLAEGHWSYVLTAGAYGQGDVNSVHNAVKRAVTDDLPRGFKMVAQSHAQLRGLCLT